MPPESNDNQDPGRRTLTNLLVLAGLLILVVGGYFLINAMERSQRALDCLSAGRNNCSSALIPGQ
jgi:hypothetical protein